MKDQIKELIVKIDGLSQLTKELKPIGLKNITAEQRKVAGYVNINSKEIEDSYDNLRLAKAWLGEVLEELGEETPYKNDGNRKTVEDIEEVADVNTESYNIVITKLPSDESVNLCKAEHWSSKNHIEKVDWLRTEIKEVIDNAPDYQSFVEKEFNEIEIVVYEKLKYGALEEGEEEAMWNKVPNIQVELELVYKYLTEAKFNLEFELERIKENK